jgi:hypothetical protein
MFFFWFAFLILHQHRRTEVDPIVDFFESGAHSFVSLPNLDCFYRSFRHTNTFSTSFLLHRRAARPFFTSPVETASSHRWKQKR